MTRRQSEILSLALGLMLLLNPVTSPGEETGSATPRPKRVLLLGQKPDSHPKATHEYMAGIRLIARYLQKRPGINVVVIRADDPWTDGPELLDGADGAILFLSEGAKWVSAEQSRLAAFERLAKRSGGLSAIHWGLGTKAPEPVPAFVNLFGGCHGGPDRKYKVDRFRMSVVSGDLPITAGITPFEVHDEVYYELKFPSQRSEEADAVTAIVPLLKANGPGVDHPVSWAWQRPDGGRSFGFTGLHFHENWNLLQYRRLIIQGILWTLNEPIPATGLDLPLNDGDLALPDSADR